MKFTLTEAESRWLNDKMAQLQNIAAPNPHTERMAHMANKIRYNTDGAPTQIFLTREQRALVAALAKQRFQSLDLVPCDEREVVVGLIKKVSI